MLIYKYKEFLDEKKIPHFYDIILKEKIWAAHPNSLNDKDHEFRHIINCELSNLTKDLLRFTNSNLDNHIFKYLPYDELNNILKKNGKETYANMIEKIRTDFGIASFSLSEHDDEILWRDYGGNGNGACIEIEIPNHNFNKMGFFRVNYVDEKIIHIDELLKTKINEIYCKELIEKILRTKHQLWSPEKENSHSLTLPT